MIEYCCVPQHTLPPWELCRCGGWDVTMIWAQMIYDAHHCHRCNRAWSVGEQIVFDAGHLRWARLPATDAVSYAKANGWQPKRSAS